MKRFVRCPTGTALISVALPITLKTSEELDQSIMEFMKYRLSTLVLKTQDLQPNANNQLMDTCFSLDHIFTVDISSIEGAECTRQGLTGLTGLTGQKVVNAMTLIYLSHVANAFLFARTQCSLSFRNYTPINNDLKAKDSKITTPADIGDTIEKQMEGIVENTIKEEEEKRSKDVVCISSTPGFTVSFSESIHDAFYLTVSF